MERHKHKSLKSLKKKAWKLMANYVKARDGYICITCGRQGYKGDPETQAGHLIHKDILDYDLRNINCQCRDCNFSMQFTSQNGLQILYGELVDKKYGDGTALELKAKGYSKDKFNSTELENIIIALELKLEELKGLQ